MTWLDNWLASSIKQNDQQQQMLQTHISATHVSHQLGGHCMALHSCGVVCIVREHKHRHNAGGQRILAAWRTVHKHVRIIRKFEQQALCWVLKSLCCMSPAHGVAELSLLNVGFLRFIPSKNDPPGECGLVPAQDSLSVQSSKHRVIERTYTESR
jgi:hypothetical protein